MKLFEKFIADSKPHADAITTKAKAITQRVANAGVVQKSGAFTYGVATRTLGPLVVWTAPVVERVVGGVKSLLQEVPAKKQA